MYLLNDYENDHHINFLNIFENKKLFLHLVFFSIEIKFIVYHLNEDNYLKLEIMENFPMYPVVVMIILYPYQQQIMSKMFHNVRQVIRKTRQMPCLCLFNYH